MSDFTMVPMRGGKQCGDPEPARIRVARFSEQGDFTFSCTFRVEERGLLTPDKIVICLLGLPIAVAPMARGSYRLALNVSDVECTVSMKTSSEEEDEDIAGVDIAGLMARFSR